MYRHPPHRPDTRTDPRSGPRQGRPGFAAPDKGPAASAVRTRNFSLLAAAAGNEEALGVALGLPLPRIKELREGYGFSNETAFHIESELSLPSGWLDRPNATVPAALFSAVPDAPDAPAEPELAAPASRTPAVPPALPELTAVPPSPKESFVAKVAKASTSSAGKKMVLISAPGLVAGAPASSAAPAAPAPPSVATPPAAPAAKTRPAKAVKQAPAAAAPAPAPVASAPPPVAPPATPVTSNNVKESPMPRGPRINEPEAMMERRRANIMVLTDFAGGKTGIGKLLGKSPANISHVLHGKKKFTREVGQEFEQALRLPAGWLDEPRQAADVPEHVKSLILEAFNQKSDGAASAPAPTPSPAAKRAVKSAVSPARAVLLAPGLSPARTAVTEMLAAAPAPSAATPTVARQVVTQPAVPAQLGVEMSQLGDMQARPIAQALVRVIILLSRSNELPEDKCLRLLNEVTMMASPQGQN